MNAASIETASGVDAPTRVLIVEDERITALNLEQRLRKLGYHVVGCVANGRAALAKAASELPDVVLMDIHIEGDIDGIETAARLRALRDIPVIYLTAFSGDETLARAQATRPHGYLIKPFAERELHATIKMAIERARVERQLAGSEQRLRLALDAAEFGTVEFDPGADRLRCDPRAQQALGLPPGVDSDWNSLLDQIAEADYPHISRALTEAFTTRQPFSLEFRAAHSDRWLWLQGNAHHDPAANEGAPARLIGVLKDVTQQHAIDARLGDAAAVLHSMREGVFVLDAACRVRDMNPAFAAITQIEPARMVGRRWQDTDEFGALGTQFGAAVARLDAVDRWQGEFNAINPAGEPIAAWLSLARVRDGDGSHIVGVLSDVSELRAAEALMHHLAHHDALTGLPNRLLFNDRLGQAITRAARGHTQFALLYIDLDRFKEINDHRGHEAGDAVLCELSRRFREVVRDTDTIARLGGDEFVVIAECPDGAVDAPRLADRLQDALRRPIALVGGDIDARASIGIARHPEDGATREALLRAADAAMYTAKEQARSADAAGDGRAAPAPSASDRDLRSALAHDELLLLYQPQRELASGRLVGFEALVRWRHPQAGLLGPEHVIPQAEAGGLIGRVGEWVLRQAMRQAGLWRAQGLPPMRIAINVSPLQLKSRRVRDVLVEAMRENGVPASCVEVEITESALQSECTDALLAISALGIGIAIDDFGTGYSGLGSMRHLPIARCKIDRMFVHGLPDNGQDAAITGAVVSLSHRLGLSVTAEGVENDAQAEFLTRLGCDEVQGFLYGRPLTADAAAAMQRAAPGRSLIDETNEVTP